MPVPPDVLYDYLCQAMNKGGKVSWFRYKSIVNRLEWLWSPSDTFDIQSHLHSRPPPHDSHLSTTAAFLGRQPIHSLLFKPLYNDHFILSPRRPLWRGSSVCFCGLDNSPVLTLRLPLNTNINDTFRQG